MGPKVVTTSGSHMNSGEGTCTLGVFSNFLCFMLLFFLSSFGSQDMFILDNF